LPQGFGTISQTQADMRNPEYQINFGPGYRVYFGRDGEVLVILLTGGTKKRQQRDIAAAIEMWTDYKSRKRPPR
jgi:putative addiction module killer protein